MPRAEPKLRNDWITPEATPRLAAGARSSASVLSADIASPKPAPVTSMPASVPVWLSSESSPPHRDPQQAERDRNLGAGLVQHPAADPRRGEERIEHRQDRESGLGWRLTDRDLEVHAAEEEDGEPREEEEQGEDAVHQEGTAGDDLPHVDQRSLLVSLVEDEGDKQRNAGGDRAQRRRVAPPPHRRLLDADHGQPHSRDAEESAAPVDPSWMRDVGNLHERELGQREQRDRHVDPEDRPPGPVLGQVRSE